MGTSCQAFQHTDCKVLPMNVAYAENLPVPPYLNLKFPSAQCKVDSD